VPLNMEKIYKISKKYNLFVYEDAAHALGSRYMDGSRVGNCKYSDLTVFSFHPIKSITTGEGGVITTNNKKIYEKLIRLRSHGIEKFKNNFVSKKNSLKNNKNSPWYFEMQELGYHYRITDIQCALGITQLKKISKFIKKRKSISKRYDLAFRNVPNCKILQKNLKKWSSHHLYVLKIDFNKINISKSEFMNKLKKKGIITQVHYIPVYLHPFYRSKKGSQKKLKNTEEYYEQALSIPIYYDLKKKDQEYVIDNIKKMIK
jgi:dTDP-4-amino-4,6-dideoxygalactose transaminase